MTEVVTKGAMPYPGMNNRQVLEAVEEGYRMPKPESSPAPLYEIMLSCWKKEPSTSVTMEELVEQGQGFWSLGQNYSEDHRHDMGDALYRQAERDWRLVGRGHGWPEAGSSGYQNQSDIPPGGENLVVILIWQLGGNLLEIKY